MGSGKDRGGGGGAPVSVCVGYVGLVCPLFDLPPHNDTAGNEQKKKKETELKPPHDEERVNKFSHVPNWAK